VGIKMKVKICFLSLHSQPYFTQNNNIRSASGGGKMLALIGKELSKRSQNTVHSASGGGKRLALMGKELSKRRDFEISFVTYGNEPDNIKKIDNIGLINAYDMDKSRNLNLFRKFFKIWHCLRKADSDVYIYSNGSTGITALYCFIYRKKYIYWMASDLAARLKGIENKESFLDTILNYIDIKFAKSVIVQNNYQKEIVEKKFKKSVILIKNPITIPEFEVNFQQKSSDKKILWVGHFSPVKQPELFLKLAKELPQYKFVMIGEKDLGNPEIFENIKKESEKITNLEHVAFVPPDKIEKYYQNSIILVNTSKNEGFPNVFLEAWVNYTPVVSLNIDPDNVIKEYQLGFHSKDFEQMKKDINKLMQDNNLTETIAKNCRKYVEINHDNAKIADQIETLIENLIKIPKKIDDHPYW
jgi:glycosyltransferase involved in cell wall biosynthesis